MNMTSTSDGCPWLVYTYIIHKTMTTLPQIRRFVLVNHSRSRELEPYHGRAVRLFPDDPRVPFHGAFIDHEMRVRGLWPYLPYYADRPITLPIQWQEWIDAPGGDGGDGGDGRGGGSDGDGGAESEDDEMGSDLSLTTVLKTGQSGCDSNIIFRQQQQLPPIPLLLGSHARPVTSNKNPSIITFRDPIANPSEFEAVMRSARQQPNWKAAQIEGESWEGTAEENISKYQKIMHPPPEDLSQLLHGLTGKR